MQDSTLVGLLDPEDEATKTPRNAGIYQSTKHDIPEHLRIKQHCFENVAKSFKITVTLNVTPCSLVLTDVSGKRNVLVFMLNVEYVPLKFVTLWQIT